VRTNYSENELDALRELANIGSGTAATSLSGLLGMPIDVAVPSASALPLADAIDAAGPAEQLVTGVALGLEADSEMAASALGEVVNILGASYLGALGSLTGLQFDLGPPNTVYDMLGAILGSILAVGAGSGDVALMLDSALIIEGQSCSLSFLLIPTADGVDGLLAQLGLG
jgi:chemotaxis protein CheC